MNPKTRTFPNKTWTVKVYRDPAGKSFDGVGDETPSPAARAKKTLPKRRK